MLLAAGTCLAAKPPEPRRIPLAPLGFETVSSKFLAAGSSLLTVHFVDDSHVLVTFAVHRLLKRLPDCPPEHDDHTIEAVLVDTSQSTVVARTEWRLHDHSRYLWSLGHGIFLLRSGEVLSTFAPMANLKANQAFLAHTVLHTDRAVEAVLLSHDRGLLTVETKARRRSTQDEASEPVDEHPVQLDFYRVHLSANAADAVQLVHSGFAHARTGVALPNDSNGFVSAVEQGRGQWAFDFHEYGGKVRELALFDSSCQPHTSLVSPSEFVALACPGGTERKLLAAFNLSGEQMWQQQFYRGYAFPVFDFAPSAGRFALSRILTNSGTTGVTTVSEQVDSQNITVYQTDSGKQLLTLDLTPMARAGGNFALSDDGMSLAVVRNDVLEILPLPELSGKDRAAIRKALATAPVPSDSQVHVTTTTGGPSVPEPQPMNGAGGAAGVAAQSAISQPAHSATPSIRTPAPADASAAATSVDAALPSPRPQVTASGDPDPDQVEKPRPRPTLYTTPPDSPVPAQSPPQ